MEPLGTQLRTAREKKSITLRQIADDTHISLRHLQNLEAGRYGELPGGMYNKAFLRAYCEYLGLDFKGLQERFEVESSPPSAKGSGTKSQNNEPMETPQISTPVILWGVMLLVSVIGIYWGRTWIAAVFSPYFVESPNGKLVASRSENRPLSTLHAGASGKPLSDELAPLSSEEDPLLGSVAGQPVHRIRLEFQVLEKCWVSVNSDGHRVLVKLLEPGDDPSFEASEHFYVILGNAGGIRAKINGKPAKSFGGLGEVVRMLINEQNLSDLLTR